MFVNVCYCVYKCFVYSKMFLCGLNGGFGGEWWYFLYIKLNFNYVLFVLGDVN